MLVGAISAQQVNLAFAFATRARLVRRYGTPLEFDGRHRLRVPRRRPRWPRRRPAELRRHAVLAAQGRVHRRTRAGARGRAGSISAALAAAPDEAVVTRLTAVRGLGRWSAEWFLARGLGRPDICPADDLGVRRAVEALCFRGRERDAAAVRRRARAWRPHRSLATHYLLAAHARVAPERQRGAGGPRRLTEPRVARSLLPLVGADPNRPDAVSLVGRYALGVTWQDGHGSIYPFTMLRAACPCGACPPAAEAWPAEIRREPVGLRVRLAGRSRVDAPLRRAARPVPVRPVRDDAARDRRMTAAAAPRRGLVVSGVMLGLFLGAMESTAVATAMPTVIASLGGLAIYSWVFSAYILAATISMPLWGRLADLYGRRSVYLTGLDDLPRRLGALGLLDVDGGADRLPDAPGARRRRAHPARHDDHRGPLRPRAARAHAGLLLGDLGARVDHRAAHRRLPDRPAVLAMGLLRQRAVRAAAGRHPRRRAGRDRPAAAGRAVDFRGAALLTAGLAGSSPRSSRAAGPGGSGWATPRWPPSRWGSSSSSSAGSVARRSPCCRCGCSRTACSAPRRSRGSSRAWRCSGPSRSSRSSSRACWAARATEAGSALTPFVLGWVTFSVVSARLLLRVGYRWPVVGGMVCLAVAFLLMSHMGLGTTPGRHRAEHAPRRDGDGAHHGAAPPRGAERGAPGGPRRGDVRDDLLPLDRRRRRRGRDGRRAVRRARPAAHGRPGRARGPGPGAARGAHRAPGRADPADAPERAARRRCSARSARGSPTRCTGCSSSGSASRRWRSCRRSWSRRGGLRTWRWPRSTRPAGRPDCRAARGRSSWGIRLAPRP